MTTVATAPAPAQQSASRLPARLRRALLLGIRAQRTQRHVYPDGIYTARNQHFEPSIHWGTVAIGKAVEQMTEGELAYFNAGLRAKSPSRPSSRRSQQVLRYSKLLRDLLATRDDEGMLRRLRLWLRKNLLPKVVLTAADRAQAAEAGRRA
jgi:hypothetical protein